MKDVLGYIESLGNPTVAEAQDNLAPLLIAFHNSLRLWIFKGHTPEEMVSGKLDAEETAFDSLAEGRKKKMGRNDPCACGSGKKYKNCCLNKSSDRDL